MQVNHYVFVKKYDGGDFLILLLYVDDILIVTQDPKKITSLKKALGKYFAMKDMGSAKQILGVYIVQDKTKKFLWFSQENMELLYCTYLKRNLLFVWQKQNTFSFCLVRLDKCILDVF